ncbi:putative 2-aminoethylphosphonate ABC transporter ATP-binding protein [Pseudorhodoferax sp.]|uniref:putative 2-aminoethylphosphonate ABC transporter ATP-binding protein n=1 Tax=Pseudorhodoferax sp. TaxID=1993553 RepID=UPI0039E598FD
MSPETYLHIEHIHKSFGAFTALDDISLSIRRGEFICFLGPSGCGKTTLLRIVAGLETQSSGTLQQAGRDISLLPPAQRDYGIVFQSYALFPNLTIADNVAYGLVNRKQPRSAVDSRVQELLQLVGLPGSGHKYPAQMSGGQQQRVALARALATSPGLLLLDEPLSALDAIVRVRLRNEIRALQQSLGVTTIMVTHDQEEALTVADRIVVMRGGVIEQVGTPMQVYREPATPFVAEFVGKANRLDAVAEGGRRFRCGQQVLGCESAASAEYRPGSAVSIYFRPEDWLPSGAVGAASVHGTVRQVEFLGSHCLAEVEVPQWDGQALQLQLSAHQMADMQVRAGAPIGFALQTEKFRVFPRPEAS